MKIKLAPRIFLRYARPALIILLLFVLMGATVPYVIQKPVGEDNKMLLGKSQFYGGEADGPDRACIIETPDDALNIRMEMLRAAEDRIDLAVHIIKDSESTRALLGEILAAAERGVSVRILHDGLTSLTERETVRLLKSLDSLPNVSCRLYNPVNPLTPWRWQSLLHDKFLLVDDTYLLLGGRNIDERHFAPDYFTDPVTNDRDVFIWRSADENNAENPSSIKQTLDYMDTLWDYSLTKPVSGRGRDVSPEGFLQALRQSAAEFSESQPRFYEKTLADYCAATHPTARVTLIHNPIEVGSKEPWLAHQLAALATGAAESVVLQTPYATGNKLLLSTIAALPDGVTLTMLTNSLASTPNALAFSNYHFQRPKFLAAGAEIWEYQCRDSIHGKSIVIDGRLSAVGSFNMDDRSMYLDTETMLVIDSPALAAELLGVMEDIRESSLMVGADNEYLPHSGRDALPVPHLKSARLFVVYLLMRPLQFLI